MGAYGNIWRAPQRPPLDQMAVSLTTPSPVLAGRPGEVLSYTLILENSGSVADNYGVSARSSDPLVNASFAADHYKEYLFTDLAPQEQISVTVWVQIPLTSTLELSNTISVKAAGVYDVADELQLTTFIPSFQETDGQVVMEAEHAVGQVDRGGRSWLTQAELSGYVGSAYVSALPDTDLQFTNTYTLTSPELYYTINVTTTQTYTVWLRGYAANGAGDSVYLSLDNQPAITLTGFAPRRWSWANTSIQGGVAAIEVTKPGLHILHVWQREDGLRLDRIILTTDNNYNPSGDGPFENEFK